MGLDPKLLWLWYTPVARGLIPPLAWEPPYATGAALKRPKKKKKCTEDPNRHFSKADIQMANRHMKIFSKSLVSKEMQTKSTIRYLLTYVRKAIIKKTTTKANKTMKKMAIST